MIDPHDLVQYVIRPTLKELEGYKSALNSEASENLLLWTALVESTYKNNTMLRQLNNGPALSIWQIEPDTHDDMWASFIMSRSNLSYIMRNLAREKYNYMKVPADEMLGNLFYACAMARLKIWRAPQPLPDAFDIEGMFLYWHRWYNTNPDNVETKRERFIALAKESLT